MILFWLFFPQMREARSNIFIKQPRKAGLQRAAKRDFTAFLFCCNEKSPVGNAGRAKLRFISPAPEAQKVNQCNEIVKAVCYHRDEQVPSRNENEAKVRANDARHNCVRPVDSVTKAKYHACE